jgi:hypothetical protein
MPQPSRHRSRRHHKRQQSSAGFQAYCIADFQVGRGAASPPRLRLAAERHVVIYIE